MSRLINRIERTPLLLACGIFVPSVFGSPITSGSLHMPLSCCIAGGSFTLSGNGFTVAGAFDQTAWRTFLCNNYLSDCLASVDGTVLTFPGFSGSATIGGTTVLGVSWSNDFGSKPSVFLVSGPPILLSGPGTYVGPFSFIGALCGTTPPPFSFPQPCEVDLPLLTGSGRISVTVAEILYIPDPRDPPISIRYVSDVTYSFNVPEPSSTVLVVTAGLVLFAGRKRLNTRLRG
jgi:hypothetical protein